MIPGGEVKTQMTRNNSTMKYINSERGLLFAALIVAVLSWTSAAPSHAQVGADNKFCPALNVPEGMLVLDVNSEEANFSGALIGSFGRVGSNVYGGLDWMHTAYDEAAGEKSASTNKSGSQLITWWSMRDSRSTRIQVTNTSPDKRVRLHVQIFDSECSEVLDFYDSFEPIDTHVYNLTDIFINDGRARVPSGGLTGREGALVVTAVQESGTPARALDFNYLTGTTYISDSLGFTYGVNMYSRQAICKAPECEGGLLSGTENSKLEDMKPESAFGLFKALSSSSGGDAVLINIQDNYGPQYLATAVSSDYVVSIVDMNEVIFSCGETSSCFLNLGIDDSFPARQDIDTLPSP